MIDPLKDPSDFTVAEMIMAGMWPPSDIAANAIYNYIKRMRVLKVDVLDVSTKNGNNAIRLAELDDSNNKINKIVGLFNPNEDYSVINKNVESYSKFANKLIFKSEETEELFDVVCINTYSSSLDEDLKKHYKQLKSGGIFCGNEHHEIKTKEALGKFRRENKIGELMHIANDVWFWYKR